MTALRRRGPSGGGPGRQAGRRAGQRRRQRTSRAGRHGQRPFARGHHEHEAPVQGTGATPKNKNRNGRGSVGNYRRPHTQTKTPEGHGRGVSRQLPQTPSRNTQSQTATTASTATARNFTRHGGLQSATTAAIPYGPVHHYSRRSGHSARRCTRTGPRVWAGVTARTCGQLQPAPSRYHAPDEEIDVELAIEQVGARVLGPSCECNATNQ